MLLHTIGQSYLSHANRPDPEFKSGAWARSCYPTSLKSSTALCTNTSSPVAGWPNAVRNDNFFRLQPGSFFRVCHLQILPVVMLLRFNLSFSICYCYINLAAKVCRKIKIKNLGILPKNKGCLVTDERVPAFF